MSSAFSVVSGVVQLFNAVRQQQSVLDDRLTDAGSSQRRRDKVMKSVSKKSFMELLGNNQSTKSSKKTRDDEVCDNFFSLL